MPTSGTDPSTRAMQLRFHNYAAVLLALMLALLLALGPVGCFGGRVVGKLRAESLGSDPVVLHAQYIDVVYSHDPHGSTSFFLSDVPVDDLLSGAITEGQIVHIDLLWRPKAGATPMDASATNACIRYVIIANGEVGIYGGAGFAQPRGAPGDDTLKLTLRDATIRLLESTDGFTDPLSPARLTGNITAKLDPKLSRKMHRAVTQLVTNALGRRRFVNADRGESAPDANRG